jgi:hypothetical protein
MSMCDLVSKKKKSPLMDQKGVALGLFGYSFSKREKKIVTCNRGEKKSLYVFNYLLFHIGSRQM